LANMTRKNKITCGIGILMHQWPFAYPTLA